MKIYSISSRLFAVVAASGLTCALVRADDGIAARAFEAQARASTPQVETTPPQAASDQKITGKIPSKPVVHRVTTVKHTETAETGIKAPPGVLIHPQVQDAGASQPGTRHHPQQEDYHVQQMY